MSSTQLQDRLAALKQKLKASESRSKISQDEGLSRSDTDNTELDVHQCDVYQSEVGHRSSTICDSPLSRQPQQSAQLDSEKESLRAKIRQQEACIKDHECSCRNLQAEVDAVNQKLTILKEQLMTSQTDAEESGRQLVEDAANELRARHANEIQTMGVKLQEQERLVQQLEQKAAQQAADLQNSVQARDAAEALQKRVMEAEASAATAQQVAARLETERNNLEAVVGELTYEAERVQKLELSMCQAQDEAKQATEAAYHARATATGAQAEAEHEKKRSAELQLRCLQLEQQLASLGSEMLTLQNHADERSRELFKWQQSAVRPDDRGSIIAALLSLVKGESDAASALETIGNLLKVEGSELEELKVHGQHISRNKGFFQRFRRLPGRLIRDGDSQRSTDGTNEDSVGQRSIATSWATFLLTDEGEGAAETSVASKAESPQE